MSAQCPARLSERAGSETSSGRVSHQDLEWFAKAAGGLQRAPADDVCRCRCGAAAGGVCGVCGVVCGAVRARTWTWTWMYENRACNLQPPAAAFSLAHAPCPLRLVARRSSEQVVASPPSPLDGVAVKRSVLSSTPFLLLVLHHSDY